MNENGTLAENGYVRELFSILQDNGGDTTGLSAIIDHVSKSENFVKHTEDKIADMKSQSSKKKEFRNHPLKPTLQNIIKSVETKVAYVKERIAEPEISTIEGCRLAVAAFREKGVAALNNFEAFWHVKSGLTTFDKSAAQSVRQCDKCEQRVREKQPTLLEEVRDAQELVDRRKPGMPVPERVKVKGTAEI